MSERTIGPLVVADRDLAAMPDLWQVFDAHREELDAALRRQLEQVPALRRIVETMDPEAMAAASERSRGLQRAALVDGDWDAYLAHLAAQGELYAQMGMQYSDWYRLLAPTRRVILPYLVDRPDGADLARALEAMIDVAMAVLGEAYVTARQRLLSAAERDRDRYVAELERSNRELDAFAYVASHDLKAPLRDIDNLASWIAEDAEELLPADSRRHLVRLRDRVQRMERLLDDLLVYSRVGRVASGSEPFDVRDAVTQALALVIRPDPFTIAVEGDWGTVTTPRAPLELVLRNLVSNAVKHHDREDGRVVVGGRVDGARIELTVEDDGPGIPPAFHDRVFQMFQTLRPRDEVEGSGMGLAIVRKVVHAHGGSIGVRSEGRGTRFTFTWPRRWPPSEAA